MFTHLNTPGANEGMLEAVNSVHLVGSRYTTSKIAKLVVTDLCVMIIIYYN